MKSEGYCFGVGRLCTRLSVCLSTCPSRNIPKYLLVRFDAFSAWMDSTMDSPKCGSRGGGAGGPDLPRKNLKLYIFYRYKQLEPPPRKKLDPPPSWKMLDPLRNLEKWWFSLRLAICDCKISWGLKIKGCQSFFVTLTWTPPPLTKIPGSAHDSPISYKFRQDQLINSLLLWHL